MKKPILPLVLILGAALGATSCGNNVQGNDASPVFLEVNIGPGVVIPIFKNVNDNAPLQIASVVLTNRLKNPTGTTSVFLDVVVEDFTVTWRRTDSGKTASPTRRFVANGIAPAGGSLNLQNFMYMDPLDLQQPPLNQLFPFNGGIDKETNSTEIRQTMTLVFHGHTMAGQAVTSVPAAVEFIFRYQAAGRVATARLGN
jgi:hypothetical protein